MYKVHATCDCCGDSFQCPHDHATLEDAVQCLAHPGVTGLKVCYAILKNGVELSEREFLLATEMLPESYKPHTKDKIN
jgi:hypothetical protein